MKLQTCGTRSGTASRRGLVAALALALLAGLEFGPVRSVAGRVPARQAASSGIAGPDLVQLSGTTMGTVEWKVLFVPALTTDGERIQERIGSVLSSLNARMSTWLDDSEVSRFNNQLSTDWFPCSAETARVVARAIEIHRISDGAFDITVKPLVELWNFGAGRGEFRIPKDAEIESALARTGSRHLEVRIDPPAVRKAIPGLQIDLSGIAKGYAVDLVAGALEEEGLHDWFIEIGGEVSVQGRKPDGSDWRIGIELPLDEQRTAGDVVCLDGRCMATSGDYRNFAIIDGRRFSHTLSPTTGWPVDNQLAGVSVIADDCMTADAMATAIMVVGAEKLQTLSALAGVEAMGLERGGAGFRRTQTPGFARFLQPVAETAVRQSRPGGSVLSVLTGAALIVGLAILALALGAIFANRPLRGSCGGMSAAMGGGCGSCGNAGAECPDLKEPGDVG